MFKVSILLFVFVFVFFFPPLVGVAIIAGIIGNVIVTHAPRWIDTLFVVSAVCGPFVLGMAGIVSFHGDLVAWYALTLGGYVAAAIFFAPSPEYGLSGTRAHFM